MKQGIERQPDWYPGCQRNKDACEAKRETISQKREEMARLEAEHAQAEVICAAGTAGAAGGMEQSQQEAAQVTAELAD